ncbi:phage protein Gp27 family protein, partial [Bilophila wadsworthia]|uniref:phage protein Gp27 family protein n=1 Tax=Bilophila wadsworthia TaxID=35833 RepID=UPI003AF0203F
QQGRLPVQTLRDLVFDHLAARVEEGDVDDPKALMALARTLKDMAQANRLDQDFEAKVRERVQKETVKAVEDTAREAGLSAETVEAIKGRILGIKDA